MPSKGGRWNCGLTQEGLRGKVLGEREGQIGNSRSVVAWTLVVSKYGARMECKGRFGANQEVTVTMLPSEKRRGIGRVVWCDTLPNKSGNVELGVKLREAEALWGITLSAG